MNNVIELIHHYSIFEYILYDLVALSFPIVMHILSILTPQLVKTRNVFSSYLFTLSAILFYISYLSLGYFTQLEFTPFLSLIYLVYMFLILINVIQGIFSKSSLLYILIPFLLLAPISLTNLIDWKVIAIFCVSYLLSNALIFFILKGDEKE